ncbi:MAG: organomercurial lyase, partial [Nitrososphaera sp.]|nr:organomercurial lyase [Nitrososphaera sp.]
MNSRNSPEFTQTLISRMERSCDKMGVCRQLLKLLANGQPVSIEQIATTLSISRAEVTAILNCFPDIQFDHKGNVIGMGLTLTPTPHHFHVNGYRLYTWCALDTLMYPVILQQAAQVKSTCPGSGRKIKLTVTPDEVTYLAPTNTVVSSITPESSKACCNTREVFCNQVSFFSS